MNAKEYWKKIQWVTAIALASGLSGALLTALHLHAGPLEIPLELDTNTTSQPILHSASYQPNTLLAYTLRSEPANSDSKPILFMLGQLNSKLILPGQNKLVSANSFAFMYVTDELKEFPSAKVLIKMEQGIVATPIDTVDTVKGLQQLKDAYAKAHGRLPQEVPQEDELP